MNQNFKTKILIAPNSFKECASSVKIADLIKVNLRQLGYINTTTFPLSDGGDGFLDVCRYHLKTGKINIELNEKDPVFNLNRIPVEYSEKSGTVFIESAKVIGLNKVPLSKRKPAKLNSRIMGILIKELIQLNAKNRINIKKIILGLGGTATNDLGLGLASCFGLRLLSANKKLKPLPENFEKADRLVLPSRITIPVEIILDVKAPLYGRQGSSRLFSPQKGADENDVMIMERGVMNILKLLKEEHKIDLFKKKYGAGGGLCVGLSLISDMHIKSSVKFLNKDLGLKRQIKNNDLIITGEGKFDEQSMLKKGAGVVIEESIKEKKKCFIITGTADKNLKTSLKKHAVFFELSALFPSVDESIRNFDIGLATAVKKLRNKF